MGFQIHSKTFFNAKNGYFKLTKILSVLGFLLLGSIILSNAVSAAHLPNTKEIKYNQDINYNNQSLNNDSSNNITGWNYTYNDGKGAVNETNTRGNKITTANEKTDSITRNASKTITSTAGDGDQGSSTPPDLVTSISKSVSAVVKCGENNTGNVLNFFEYTFLFGYVTLISYFIIKWLHY